MAKKMAEPKLHPDDLMSVTLSLEFRAKLNPDVSDPPPFDTTMAGAYCLPAAEAADYLEDVVKAIRERRLYGFMVQEAAENAVGAGEWVEKSIEEVIADAAAQGKRDNGSS